MIPNLRFVKRDAIVSGKEYAHLLGELKDLFVDRR